MMTARKELVLTIMSGLALILAIIAIFITQVHYNTSTQESTATTSETTYEIINESSQIIPTIVPTEPSMTTTTTSYKEPEVRYNFTDEEYYLLAQLLCGSDDVSGDGEYDFVWRDACINGYYVEISKILGVVMNRQRSPTFPNTIKEIILQKGQFVVMPNNLHKTPPLLAIEEVQRWCEAYNNYDPKTQIIPEDHLYFHAGKNNTTITSDTWR